MSRMTPSEMAQIIGGGLLSFPVTHFDAQHQFQEDPYREHCGWMLERELAGLFAAGGTGEFFSLRPEEVAQVVRAAVAETNGKVPVIAGCGYGTAIATDLAQSAEKEGADGILLLPPYLMNSTQDGLASHVEAVCKSTSLGVIVYNRDNAVLNEDTLEKLCARNANLVGFKDGVGDIELMMRVYARMGDRLTYIGGLPTAETFALPYLEMGVTTYSSAVFNFVPELALRFYRAIRQRDGKTVQALLKSFYLPLIELRDKKRGYAVSMIKAGADLVGRPAGKVRSPLTELSADERETLAQLIATHS